MSDTVETKITIKSDRTTGMSFTGAGANLDGIAFNMTYIIKANPELAKRILEMYESAKGLE